MPSKNKKMTTISQIMIFIGLLITALGGLLYYIYSSKESNVKHAELVQNDTAIRNDLDRSKSDILDKQDTSFKNVDQQLKKLDTNLSKMKKTKPGVKIENSPNSVVQFNEKGDNIVNQPKEEYKPRIVFFNQNIDKKIDAESGLVVMKFYFGSQDGFPLTNPSIDITFNSEFDNVSGGVTGTGMVMSGNLQREIPNGNKRFVLSTNLLNAGNYFFIETRSKSDLKIVELKMKP